MTVKKLWEDVMGDSKMSSVGEDIIRKKYPQFFDYIEKKKEGDEDVKYAVVKQGLLKGAVPIAWLPAALGGQGACIAWIEDRPKHITSQTVMDRVRSVSEGTDLLRDLVREVVESSKYPLPF